MEIEPHWYLASYPKSGNTWCRVFIAELHKLISLENGLDDDEYELNLNRDIETGQIISSRVWIDDQLGFDSNELDFDELDIMRGNIVNKKPLYYEGLRYHKVHDSYLTCSNKERSIINPQNCGGIVYIVRNPFDIVISLSYFFNWSIDKCIEFILDEDASLCSSKRKLSFQVRQFLGDWGSHVNSWINQKEIPILVVKYEDLLEKPLIYFRSVANFLNIKANDKLLRRAIQNASFSKLQLKEKNEGGFNEKPEKCQNFFRSGKSGEGLQKLNSIQIDLITKRFSKTLTNFEYINS